MRRWAGLRRSKVGAVTLVLFCGTAALAIAVTYRYHLGVAQTLVASLISGGAPAAVYLAWATYKLGASTSTNQNESLARIADELASQVRIQWTTEAAMRRLNDPYPLPVRWTEADTSIVDDWTLITKLATSGAGWPPRSESWARGPEELAGTENQLAEVLARVPTGRLVVLGEPGAGKTMLMVRLVLDLLAPGRRSAGEPVPILLTAASWNPAKQDFRDWLIARLVFYHPILTARTMNGAETASLVSGLLDNGYIVPIIDGFDEIPDPVRISAISKINEALKPGERLVLTCRTADYRKAVYLTHEGRKITLRGAAGIKLQPLDPADIADYLRKDADDLPSHDRWKPVISLLGTSAPVAQVLSRPLMASLARTVYSPRPGEYAGKQPDPAELCVMASSKAIERHLFDAFIPAAYRGFPGNASRHRTWPKRHADRWLRFLAQYMQDGLTPDLAWWQLIAAIPRFGRVTLGLPIGVIGGCIIALASRQLYVALNSTWPLVYGLIYAVIFFVSFLGSFRTILEPVGTETAASPTELLKVERRKAFLNRIGVPIATGVAAWAVSGIFVGFRTGIAFGILFLAVIVDLWNYPKSWPNFLAARCWLAYYEHLPWRLMTFLRDAHERGILRQVGTVYQFRHIELQRRLAARDSKPAQASTSHTYVRDSDDVPNRSRSFSGPALDDITLSDIASEAMWLAAAERQDGTALDTKAVFSAIARSASNIDWYRVESLARDPGSLTRSPVNDPTGYEGETWNDIPVTASLGTALRMAWKVLPARSGSGGLQEVPPSVLAVSLIANPGSGAARAFIEGFGISHAELVKLVEEAVGEGGIAKQILNLQSTVNQLIEITPKDHSAIQDAGKPANSSESDRQETSEKRSRYIAALRGSIDSLNRLAGKVNDVNPWRSEPVDPTYAFVARLVERRFGKDARDQERRVALIAEAWDKLDRYLMERQLMELSAADLAKFTQLLESGATKGDLQQFTMSKIPDFVEFIGFALGEFEKDYLREGSS